MRRFIGTIGVVALFGIVSATEPAKTPPIEILIQQLGEPRFEDRERASFGLRNLGTFAIPALKQAVEQSTDAEVRDRAETLLIQLGKMAESERYLVAKTIALDYRNIPVSAVVADFAKKTGINLILVVGKVKEPNRIVTVTSNQLPIWQALDAICLATGLCEDHRTELPLPKNASANSTSYYSNGRAMRMSWNEDGNNRNPLTPGTAPILLIDGKGERLASQATGPVRVLSLPAHFPGNRITRGAGRVQICLDVAPLPGLNWQGASNVRVTRATDEDGRPLFADLIPEHEYNLNNYGNWGWGGRVVMMGVGGGQFMQVFDGDNGGNPQVQTTAPNPRLAPLAMRTDDRSIRRLQRLEGVVSGDIHVPNVPIVTIDQMANSVGKSTEGPYSSKLTVSEYTMQKDGSTTVHIRGETMQQWVLQQMMGGRAIPPEALNIGNLINTVKFYDAQGKVLPAPQQTATNYSGDGWRQTIDVTLKFPKSSTLGVPTKIVQTGTKVVSVDVPFQLENVKLP